MVRVDKDEDGRVTEEEVAEVNTTHTIQSFLIFYFYFMRNILSSAQNKYTYSLVDYLDKFVHAQIPLTLSADVYC